jgi:hypothetical protein
MKRPSTILSTLLLVLPGACALGAPEFTLVKQLTPLTPGGRVAEFADLWAEGDYAYIGCWDEAGVAIFNIADPANAFYVTHYTAANDGQFLDVKVLDGIGYFASNNGGGVHVVDLSDPTNPTLLTQVDSSDGGHNSIHNISVFGDVLYEADGDSNVVKVFDISSPSAPSFVRNIHTLDSRIHDITALGDRLYTSGFNGKTEIYDVSGMSPTQAPMLLGSKNTGSSSHSNWVSVDGSLLVSARETNNGDLRLYDISNPSNWILRSTITRSSVGISASSPHNPIIVGDILYSSWYEAGVEAFDISDPANPVRIAHYDTYPGGGYQYGAWGVYPLLGEDRILVSDFDGGLFIFSSSGIDYDDWTGKFPGADLSDPNGDFDGDRLSNNQERLFGLDPASFSSVDPFTTVLDPVAGTISYTRRATPWEIAYTVWTSTDLETWTEDAGALQSAGAPVDDIETVTVTISPALLSEARLFLRVGAAE